MSDNTAQRDFWTDDAGPIWVEQRAVMDAMFAPVLDETLARAQLSAGYSVLDIGCGAGTSTLAVADKIGDAGHVTGIDISRTLLEEAQARSLSRTNVAFLDADAQIHPFVPQSADAIISRFGVMFFEDSSAAFANMASALPANGIFSFSSWGAISENPFFTLPAQIAREILGPVPKSDPDAAGPFAFRDPAYVNAMLKQAGLRAEIETVDIKLVFDGSATALARTMSVIGPAQMAISHHRAGPNKQQVLIDALIGALGVYQKDGSLGIPAQINYVTARKAS